jgi:hypothetical protein
MDPLPAPQVVRCYFDDGFQPRLAAMDLRWDPEVMKPAERLWYLPEGVCMVGPAPERFGISVTRRDTDSYAVRVLWDRTGLTWRSLTRAQLLTSALAPLLATLGTDLQSLLDQPRRAQAEMPRLAA